MFADFEPAKQTRCSYVQVSVAGVLVRLGDMPALLLCVGQKKLAFVVWS